MVIPVWQVLGKLASRIKRFRWKSKRAQLRRAVARSSGVQRQTCKRQEYEMAKLRYFKNKPYYSTLTRRYYPDYDAAFRESLRAGGGAEVDFNLYYMHPDGTFEYVF